MTVLRYYSILSEFVVLFPFHPSIDSAAAQDEIQSGMLCDDYESIWWTQIIPNPRSLCYLIAVHLTKHHSENTETQGEKPEKGPKPRNSFRQGAGDLGFVFSFRESGGQNPLKTLSEDGDGNEKWCGWMSYNQCLEGFEEWLCLTTDDSKIE